eukprot:11531109-Alexandrium_andersonii.AAC.1
MEAESSDEAIPFLHCVLVLSVFLDALLAAAFVVYCVQGTNAQREIDEGSCFDVVGPTTPGLRARVDTPMDVFHTPSAGGAL